jgi:hypothetical protein
MPFSPRAIGGALALGRVDLGVQGDHDLVERATRARNVHRVLNPGGEPSVVDCGPNSGEHRWFAQTGQPTCRR